MTETERERELLKRALAEAHRSTRRRTPAFGVLWSRAVAARKRPRRAPGSRRLALGAAAAAALVLAATLALWTADRQSRSELEGAMTIAAALGEWKAPLDFLLETPGKEWLEAAPRWDPAAAAERWRLDPDLLEPDSL